MGIVYLAEQDRPIRCQVALKIIKLGMDAREVVNRFDAERQALALMDHPCIAAIHDAGVTIRGIEPEPRQSRALRNISPVLRRCRPGGPASGP